MLAAGGFRFGVSGPTGVTRVAVLSGGGREGAGDPEPARPAWLGALSLGGWGRGPAAGWGPAWPAGGCAARSGPMHSAQRGDRRRPRSPSAEKARRRSVYPHMGVSVHACMGGQSRKRPAPPADAGDHLQGAAGGGTLRQRGGLLPPCGQVQHCALSLRCLRRPQVPGTSGFRKSPESRQEP